MLGNCMPLRLIPVGTSIHNIELQPGRGGQMCRSAGVSAVMNASEGDWAQITLPSGEVRRVPATCRATIGTLGFSEHSMIVIGKAGRVRRKGIRPYVRGSAMNPISHPMGGGEGRRSGGRHPVESGLASSAKGLVGPEIRVGQLGMQLSGDCKSRRYGRKVSLLRRVLLQAVVVAGLVFVWQGSGFNVRGDLPWGVV